MSLGEFMAAIEGLRESYGEKDAGGPSRRSRMSWDDFEHLKHRMGPTKSIRTGGKGA